MFCKIQFTYKGKQYLPGDSFDLLDLDPEDSNDIFKHNHFTGAPEITSTPAYEYSTPTETVPMSKVAPVKKTKKEKK